MEVKSMQTKVIQCINRVRCRKVTDALGNCDPTDIYILLPKGKLGDKLLEGIKKEMPDIRTMDWNIKFTEAGRKKRSSKFEDSLIHYFANMNAGQYLAKDIKTHIGVSTRQWKRLIEKLKDETSELFKSMKSSGVVLVQSLKGRGSTTIFVKA
ncbi:hypothetical protein A9Q83_10025 [Alphaproteobacteria bacterium 46_93_T64]|nr:hypothetical protein A9Q83_10025 [Alphaproteobacteria bacterium 46_93_T64]